MEIDELKKKFRHKRKLGYTDIDLALQAVPFLIREIETLEKKIQDSEDRITHLTSLMKKRPPLSRKGKKGDSFWEATVDEKKNRLFLKFTGHFDYLTAKLASNNILPTLVNIREGGEVINDISDMLGVDRRALFHFRKIIYTLNHSGVELGVHVLTKDTKKPTALLDIFEKEVSGRFSTAATVAEAETFLDSCKKFLKG